MPLIDPAFWSDYLGRTLTCYDEPLLRQVVARLIKPRNQWPVEELIERSVAAASNAAVIDRRLQDLDQAERRLLALMAHSRQPRWSLGNLIELVLALGHADGLKPVLNLFEAGLLYPDLQEEKLSRLKSFEQWLSHPGTNGLPVFAHPLITARALSEDLGLPSLDFRFSIADFRLEEGAVGVSPIENRQSKIENPQEADGLEWPLRLTVLWQQTAAGPLRRTQQGGFFKRDQERLAQDPLLNGSAAESLAMLPDAGLLTVALAEAEGIVREADGELRAATLPAHWDEGLLPTLETLWAALFRLRTWNAGHGWLGGEQSAGNPYPSAYLLAFLLLARLPEDGWARPADLDRWLRDHHPYWKPSRPVSAAPDQGRSESSVLGSFLLGLAYQLRLLQAAKDTSGNWLVRLSPTGRGLLGLAEMPAKPPGYPQTLTVQPNLEIVAYRQGLSPGLIARLGQFATWKSLGAACTLQLEPESVYRALESGLTFDTILRTLEQHGMRATPTSVVEALRTWAGKRDRISIYAAAVLLEFNTPDDLNAALARGLPATRVSERLAVAANESAIDFRHFRLTGTRDYGLPPEKCVTVEEDGVTLTIDLARSDLLLETELPRFAERLEQATTNGRGQYRLTPASLAAARTGGMSVHGLEAWFQQRSGRPLSPAARLLLTGAQTPAPDLRRHLVLHVATEELADGLWQWPGTRPLLAARLGPAALVVAEEKADELRERLRALGIQVAESGAGS